MFSKYWIFKNYRRRFRTVNQPRFFYQTNQLTGADIPWHGKKYESGIVFILEGFYLTREIVSEKVRTIRL